MFQVLVVLGHRRARRGRSWEAAGGRASRPTRASLAQGLFEAGHFTKQQTHGRGYES